MRSRFLVFSLIVAAITVFAWSQKTSAETVCLPTPPRGAPILNRWPIQTNGADCTDYPLLAVKNLSGGDYVNGGSVSANPGDTLKVRLYVHNGVLDYPENEAINVMVSANIPSGQGSQQITASAWANNASAIDSNSKGGNVTVNLAGTDYLEYIPGSAQVYGRGPVLLGSFSDSVANGAASLGNMPGCFPNLRFVTFLVKVVRRQPAPGTIYVSSNIATSWVITGPDNFSGSGVSASYTARPSPSDYFINVPNIAGYEPPIITPSISQTLPQGGTIHYNIRYDLVVVPLRFGRIVVNSNVPTSWVITGPQNFSGSGTSSVYQNVPVSPPNYTISVPSISGYSTPVVTPSASQTLNDQGTVTYNINYSLIVAGCSDNASVTLASGLPGSLLRGQTYQLTIKTRNSGDTWWYNGSYYQLLQTSTQMISPSYGHISPAMNPGDEQDKVFSLTAPNMDGSYALSFQMIHRAGADYLRPSGSTCAPGPSNDTYFGNVLTVPFTVSGGISLNPPTLSADNTACSSIRLTWQDNSSNESGFRILRASPGASFVTIATLPANATTFTDTPPAGLGYSYRIQAFINSPSLLSDSNTVGPVMSAPCAPDLSQSKKKLVSVTEITTGKTSTYSSSTLIRSGDTLTYEILISNKGTAAADITRITDHLEANLINPRNVRLNKPGGSSLIGFTRSGADIIFNASGTLPVHTNWIISFDVTLASSSLKSTETVKNCATIDYFFVSAKQLTVCHGPVIINRIGAGAPVFREATP